ncbi:MAG: hypothetical protein IPO21_13455 [Bacteroidales bacterium]|nr:hypothetical protein [Bacteroidales bacterium]
MGRQYSPDSASTSFKNFKLGGYAVDMQPTADGFDNAVITGKILIPNAYKTAIAKYPNKFILRVSVFDAHGHEWNAGGDPFDTLDVFGEYTNFSVSYNTEDLGNPKPNPGDGWGGKFHNRLRPTKGADTTRVPIDFTKIMGLKFYLCPGEKSGAAITGEFVKIKDVVIGADATTPGVFNPWEKFITVGLTDVTISEFAYENGAFTFEGAGQVVDLLGRVVLQGEGSISIESLEKGTYVIVAEGKSAKFQK